MKKLKYIIITLLLFTLGCNNKEIIKTPPEDFYIVFEENKTVEIYTKVYLSDFINNTNGTLLNGNNVVDTTKLGTIKEVIKYSYLGEEYSNEIEFEIVDTTPPLILGGSSKTLIRGYNGDLCNLILFADNYDKKAKCLISGNYNLNEIGTYNITFNISDISNNISTLDYKINIINKSNQSSIGNALPIKFSDILDKHKSENTEVGIDVSKWQGNIDFNKIKEAGATFVIMRIGVQKSIKGELEIDPYYHRNIKEAKKAGLKIGVYLYSIATSVDESIEQANWVIEKLEGTELDLPIVFDWESWSIWNSLNLSLYDINSIADAFFNTITKSGYDSMLYGSKYYLQHIWTNDNEYPVWLAHYTSQTDYEGDYYIWQLGDTGRINGINGAVDINIMYKQKY